MPAALSTETETRIFEAALRVFAAKGRDGARMQEIADAASVNKAMLHYYFRSKDALYERVFDFVIGKLIQAFADGLRPDGSFADTLHGFIDTYLDFTAAHPDLPRLMANEMLAGAPVAKTRLAPIINRGGFAESLFFARVEQAVAAGEIRPVSAHHLFLTVLAACVFPLIAHPLVAVLIPQSATDPAAFLVARKEEIFRLVYDGLRPADG